MSQNEIVSETNYYPFGLAHKGYNEVSTSSNLGENWKYQGQERTPEMDLNIDEWKYRVSDPAIGRFWQIDPLAEDYVYNSTYAFQENKMGMGIELEGAELLGFKKAQKIIHRASEYKSGVNKMATGGANLISKSINQNTPTNNTPTPNFDNNTIISNPDFQTMGEGSSKIVNALPNKQDARNLADGAELTGDALVVSAPFTGPLAPEVAAIGGTISTVGFAANLALDLTEGDLEAAATRAGIELSSMGMGSLVKNAGGDRVAEELTNTVLNRTGESIQKIVTEDKEKIEY